MSLFYVCTGAQYCEPLLWRHLYSRDTSIQEKQIFAQKNVEIIFVYVTSNSGI